MIRYQTYQVVSFAIGIQVVGISILVLIGHLIGIERIRTWGGEPAMAVPTAVCFLLIGVDRILAAFREQKKKL